MPLHYAIDSVAVNGQMIFGWGWCFSELGEHADVQMKFEHADGTVTWLKCQSHIARVDVLASHSGHKQSVRSGFRFSASAMPDLANTKVFLYLMTHDGAWENTELPDLLPNEASALEKKRRIKNDKAAISSFHKANAGSGRETVLLVDHAMGGGANMVSSQWIRDWTERGLAVLALRFDTSKLRYVVQYSSASDSQSISSSEFSSLALMLDRWQFSRIEVNSLVSFPEVFKLLSFVIRQKSRKAIPLAYYVHDFHGLCDSWSLINQHEHYCALPEASICRKCIDNRPEVFPALQKPSAIGEWRQHWRKFLIACDSITFFSESSRKLFRQTYKNVVTDDKSNVKPHLASAGFSSRIAPLNRIPFVIGVVGNISIAKGANLLRDMARLILKEKLPLKIVVIGNVETYEPSDAYFATGTYKHDELPALLETHGVGLCFLPSICPETFSFVVSEIIQLELPLICFNIGAQAERVAAYGRGHVISETTAAAAVSFISNFAKREAIHENDAHETSVIDRHARKVAIT